MTTMNKYQQEKARYTYIASLGSINVTDGADTSEFKGQSLDDLFNSSIEDLCGLLESVDDDTAAAIHAESWLRNLEGQGFANPDEHEENLPFYIEHVINNGLAMSGKSYAYFLREAAYEQYYVDGKLYNELEGAISFLAKANVDDELGTLSAIRCGVPFEQVFAF